MSDHPGIWYPPFRVMGLDEMMAIDVKRAAPEHTNFTCCKILPRWRRLVQQGLSWREHLGSRQVKRLERFHVASTARSTRSRKKTKNNSFRQ